jgi:hypothetical protein
MEHDLHPLDRITGKFAVAQVALHKFDAVARKLEILEPTARKVIRYPHAGSERDEAVNQMTANEGSAPRDEDPCAVPTHAFAPAMRHGRVLVRSRASLG